MTATPAPVALPQHRPAAPSVPNGPSPSPAPLLERLRDGAPALIMGIRGGRTADVIRIARSTGHDAVLIDLEHASMPIDVAAQLCATAGDLGLTAFVRVPEREYGAIGRLLDGGAHGIIAPRIESVEQARDVARACRFAPRGQRSQLAMTPHTGMRPTPARVLNPALDDATIVQILLETPEGIAHADEIAALDGVDMLAVGANDLTAELGIPGQYGSPLLAQAVAQAAEACRRHGKLLMLGGVSDREVLAPLLALGACPLLLTGMDTELLWSAASDRADSLAAWAGSLAAARPSEAAGA